MAGMCVVLQTVADPLCLSLALDIMEEVLGSGDSRRYGRLMAREGALAALVCCTASYNNKPAIPLFNDERHCLICRYLCTETVMLQHGRTQQVFLLS